MRPALTEKESILVAPRKMGQTISFYRSKALNFSKNTYHEKTSKMKNSFQSSSDKSALISIMNKENKFGHTMLHQAVAMKDFETVQFLCENGGSINIQDKHQRTALHIAAIYGYLEIFEYLLMKNADFLLTAKHKTTVAHSDSEEYIFIRYILNIFKYIIYLFIIGLSIYLYFIYSWLLHLEYI
jgi:ankyrin repeat protein